MNSFMLMEKFLPLNRKEIYYTSNVLPPIVCYNNNRYIDKFFSLIDKDKCDDMSEGAKLGNILYFSEYNFKDSIFMEKDKQRFEGFKTIKRSCIDTLIFIEGQSHSYLIGIGGKMYNRTFLHGLNRQMEDQYEILFKVQEVLNIDCLYHYALVPQKMHEGFNDACNKFKYIH